MFPSLLVNLRPPSAESTAPQLGGGMMLTSTTAAASKSNRIAPPSSNNDLFLYFALGAVMNPVSLRNRGIVPIASEPGELIDFELKFTGSMGFAEAVHRPGSSFHGVLHLIDAESMERLDKLEIAYERVQGKVVTNDGRSFMANLYTKVKSLAEKDELPSQRYLDVLIEGAEHFKVHPDQVECLKQVECIPRPSPQEYKSFPEPADDSPKLSYERDVKPFKGEDSPYLRLAVNGKVIEICLDDIPSGDGDTLFWNSLQFYKMFGQRLELVFSRIMYDPKYGVPENLEDFTQDHAAYIEHNQYKVAESHGVIERWKTIGRIEQSYKE